MAENNKNPVEEDCTSSTESQLLHNSSSECSIELSQENVSIVKRDWLPCLSDNIKSQLPLRIRQIITFVLLSSAYAATYLLRKPFGIIKQNVKTEFDVDLGLLGWLEFAMFLPYSVISLSCWKIGKKIGPRKTLGLGLLIASASTSLMATVKSLIWLFILFFIIGSAQALCWPASCTMLASWFSLKIRNTVVGTFGSVCFFGGATGTFLVVYLNETYQWRGVFLWPALLVAFRGVIVIMVARKPAYHGLIVPDQDENDKYTDEDVKSLKEIWNMSLVPEISITLLCLKFVRYGIMMWLPMYLQTQYDFSIVNAGLTSVAFEAGGVLGSLGIGLLLDFAHIQSTLFVTSIAIAGSSMALTCMIIFEAENIIYFFIFLSLAGALNCGTDLVLAGSAINKLIDEQGSNASIMSVINGIGSLGIVLEGPLIAYSITLLGFSVYIPILITFSIIGTISVYRAYLIQTKAV